MCFNKVQNKTTENQFSVVIGGERKIMNVIGNFLSKVGKHVLSAANDETNLRHLLRRVSIHVTFTAIFSLRRE